MEPLNSAAPAITARALTQAAGRKARRVQQKLHEAEAEVQAATAELLHASIDVNEAVELNTSAERKVHEAVEELEVVKEMLEHADCPDPSPAPSGASGDGVKSMLPHLRRRA
jgi:hypothetical protein